MITDQIVEERPAPEPWAQDEIAAMSTTLADWEEQARTRIRQRPIVALLAALGAGYLLARLVARAAR